MSRRYDVFNVFTGATPTLSHNKLLARPTAGVAGGILPSQTG